MDKPQFSELEDEVKELKLKVANLFMDNVALTTKLKAGREVEAQQKRSITSLEERLVQALKREVRKITQLSYSHTVQ